MQPPVRCRKWSQTKPLKQQMTCHPETTILILKTGVPSATHLCYTPEKLAFLEDIAKKDGNLIPFYKELDGISC